MAIDVALMRGQVDAARQALASLRKAAPGYPELTRYEGTIALAAGDGKTALKSFAQIYRERPDTRSALNLAAVQERLGNLAAAEEILRNEQARAPSSAVLDELAALLEKREQWPAARDTYRRLLADSPDDAVLLKRFALVLQRLNDPAALATADKARALAPNDPSVIDTVGWVRLQSGDVDGAIALLRDARLRAPENPVIRYHLASALAKSGRTGEAKAELEVALSGQPDFPGVAQARALKAALAR